jgi:endo-1,4-beta-xylanase
MITDSNSQFFYRWLLTICDLLGSSKIVFHSLVIACAIFTAVNPVTGQDSTPRLASGAIPLSLKQAAGGKFMIGVGAGDRIPIQPENWDLLLKEFSVVTPENCMKPQGVQHRLGHYRFETADRFVDFAVRNGLQIVGHCLIWAKDDRTHEWYYLDEGQPASAEVLLDRIRTDVRTIVCRYKGKIAMWDVVNEALSDDAEELLRPSGYVTATGDEFIVQAFQAAHEADPSALLIYNDYNNELPAKRTKMMQLIESLQQRQVPIHAVGIQGHYEIDQVPFQALEETIIAVKQAGLKVVISELDIDMIPRGAWWADGGSRREELSQWNPYADGCPPELLERQAEQYARLFELFEKYSDTILRVSFWNLHDGESWLNYFPWNRVNHPLLFDRNRQPKPAYNAVLRVLSGD